MKEYSNVSVFNMDIAEAEADAIVNAANGWGYMGGKRFIARSSGKSEPQYRRKNGDVLHPKSKTVCSYSLFHFGEKYWRNIYFSKLRTEMQRSDPRRYNAYSGRQKQRKDCHYTFKFYIQVLQRSRIPYRRNAAFGRGYRRSCQVQGTLYYKANSNAFSRIVGLRLYI